MGGGGLGPEGAAWPDGPAEPRADEKEVHVWRVAPGAASEAALAAVLSPGEAARARRFLRDHHRRRFERAHGALRRILGAYLRRNPRQLVFGEGEHGKPFLEDAGGLRFNLAHSGELALVAVTRGRALGVDVEACLPGRDLAALAGRFFAPGEAARLAALPAAQRERAFYACWTRKEAFLKATGKGLGGGLASFEVAFEPGRPAALLRVRDRPGEAGRWRLESLDPGPGFAGALLVEGGDWDLSAWEWRAGG